MQPLWQALLMAKSISNGLAAEDYITQFFANGGRTGGVLSLSAALAKKSRDNVEEGFRATYEKPGEAFKVITLREDVGKFTPTQMSGSDAQLMETRTFQVLDVARWYRLPPHKLGLDGSSSYNSVEEDNRAYWSSCIQQHTTAIEDESTFKLCMNGQRISSAEFFTLFDNQPMLALSPKEQMEVSAKGVAGGVLTINEGRAPLGFNPVEGGDVVNLPLNVAPAGQDTTPGTDKGTAPRSLDVDAFREAVWPFLSSELDVIKRQAGKGQFHLQQWHDVAIKRIQKKIEPICRMVDVEWPTVAEPFLHRMTAELGKGGEPAKVCDWFASEYQQQILETEPCEK